MKSLTARLLLTGIAVVAAIYGCSDDSGSPTGPANNAGIARTSAAADGDCGAADYLTALSPVLAEWQDSLESAFAKPFDDPPVFDDESVAEPYLEELAPVLQQWEMTINEAADSAIVDSVPGFDSDTDSTPEYLVGLSATLQQWKSALDKYAERELLPAPPVYKGDTAPPVIICPENRTVGCADSSGIAVDFEGLIEVMDDCDPSPTVTCEPASGSVFPLGTTTVTCTATDSVGNESECTFDITVEFAEAPMIDCPADTTVECTGPDSTVVEFVVTATSACDTAVVVVCDPPSGSGFGPGKNVVLCTATDSFGNVSECSFNIFVEDTTDPVITCPADTTLQCTGDGGAVLEFAATATDICDPEPVIECVPPSGSTFPLGETVVTCTARDAAGNSAFCTFVVTVEDTTAPVITDVEPSRDELWPPNHKMVDVSISVDATDVCDSTPWCYIVDVWSDEDVNGNGDGNTEPDWAITGDLRVKLRAERAGPEDGRTYYILVRCQDDSGNESAGRVVEVHVPHDRGHNASTQ